MQLPFLLYWWAVRHISIKNRLWQLHKRFSAASDHNTHKKTLNIMYLGFFVGFQGFMFFRGFFVRCFSEV